MKRDLLPDEFEATVVKAKVNGMEIEVSEEGITFTGMLLTDPVEALRDALTEINHLRKGLCLIRAKKYPAGMSAVDVAHLYLECGAE